MNIEDTIRRAVGESDKSQRQLGRESGLSGVAVHKFLKHGMSLCGNKLERLGKAAGVKLVCKRIPKR
tara:strand:- start:9292 stop:9492 length:201 start_codon:yes stop_codon:yes gene_type:complete